MELISQDYNYYNWNLHSCTTCFITNGKLNLRCFRFTWVTSLPISVILNFTQTVRYISLQVNFKFFTFFSLASPRESSILDPTLIHHPRSLIHFGTSILDHASLIPPFFRRSTFVDPFLTLILILRWSGSSIQYHDLCSDGRCSVFFPKKSQ